MTKVRNLTAIGTTLRLEGRQAPSIWIKILKNKMKAKRKRRSLQTVAPATALGEPRAHPLPTMMVEKHKHVGMSGSTHCEYMALASCCRLTRLAGRLVAELRG